MMQNNSCEKQKMKYEISEYQVQSLIEIQNSIYMCCVDAGWHSDIHTGEPKQRNFAEAIALMHSELSEALEGWRKNLKDSHLPDRSSVEVELADAVIRIFDTCGANGYDLPGAIRDKFAYNQEREDHKIANRRLQGGKKI